MLHQLHLLGPYILSDLSHLERLLLPLVLVHLLGQWLLHYQLGLYNQSALLGLLHLENQLRQ